MKRFAMIGLVSIVLLSGMGCCSPTIDQWCDRNEEGLTYAHQHVEALVNQVDAGLKAQILAQIEALDDELDAVVTGKVEGVTYSREWLRAHRITVEALREANEDLRNQLHKDAENAHTNLDEISDGLTQIKRLRRAWTVTDEMRAEVDQLSNLVQRLIVEIRNKETD